MSLTHAKAWEIAHKHTAVWEGGFANDPVDPGGATNYGVSLRWLKSIGFDVNCDGKIDINDIKKLTKEQVAELFRVHFWHDLRLDDLPPIVAIVQYDCAVNTGPGRASKILQSACNGYAGSLIQVDGIIGPITRARVKGICVGDPEKERFLALRTLELRRKFYADLVRQNPKTSKFSKGWGNRVDALEKVISRL